MQCLPFPSRRIAAAVLLAWTPATVSCGAFVGYVVTAIDVDHEGTPLTVYTVSARFDATDDAVLLAYGLRAARPEDLRGFWHKDLATPPSEDAAPALTLQRGSWSPSQIKAPKLNRAFDSFVTIGGAGGMSDTTTADPSWSKSGPAGWERPDLPPEGHAGWFAVAPKGARPGKAGQSPQVDIAGSHTLENPITDVRLAQLVRSRGDAPGEFELSIAWTDGAPGTPQRLATAKFRLERRKPGNDAASTPPGTVK